MTSIGAYAFSGCTSLSSVTFQGNTVSIDYRVFDIGANKQIQFIVPNGTKAVYEGILTAYVMNLTTAVINEVPLAPSNLKGSSGGYNSSKLTWTAVTGATGYAIYRSASSTSGFTGVATATSASYTNSGLTTGTTYYYQIKAYTTVGTTKIYSAATSAVYAKPILATPTGLKAVSAGYNSSKLTWTAATGATGYAIYRSTSSISGFTSVATATSASYTNTGLTTGTTYYYQVKAYTTVGTTKIYSAATAAAGAKP